MRAKPAPGAPRPPAIEALAISPIDAGEMWVSTTNRLVQLTRDGGAHWQKVTPPGVDNPSEILYAEPSHFDCRRGVFDGGNKPSGGACADSSHARLWCHMAIDREWACHTDESVLVVREDTVRKGLLYAGTASTVYVSFDDGDHWHPLTLESARCFGYGHRCARGRSRDFNIRARTLDSR